MKTSPTWLHGSPAGAGAGSGSPGRPEQPGELDIPLPPVPPLKGLKGEQASKTPTPNLSLWEGNQIFKPFLAANAAKNSKKEGSPARRFGHP